MGISETKKLKYLFAIVAIGFNSAAFAAESDVLTTEQAARAFKVFTNPSQISGTFEQVKVIKDIDVSLKTTGTFQIQKASAQHATVFWNIEKPQPMKVCLTPSLVVIDNAVTKKKTTVNLNEVSVQDSAGMSKLFHLINLDPVEMGSLFDIRALNKSNSLLLISPKKKDQYSFQKATIELDKNKNLKKLELVESNNDTLEIRFLKVVEKTLQSKVSNKNECL